MRRIVVVDAVRTPFGKRGGQLSGIHATQLLGLTIRSLINRTGLDPTLVEQVIGGCVGQAGMQAMNVTRNAWLAEGLPIESAATTVDAQCGSSQQAANLAFASLAAGVADVAIACGVEVMSSVPLGSTVPADGSLGKPITKRYWAHHEFTTQFEGAERMAEKWGASRADCDAFALQSQNRAAAASNRGAFESQLVEVEVPNAGGTLVPRRDEGIRPTSLDSLAKLTPSGRPEGVHTAASSSQISDGASAMLLTTEEAAERLGLQPLAEIVDTCLVGSDPVLMLTGPITATQRLLQRNDMSISDINLIEINEAFASVVLAWQRELGADPDRVNPNGGAIAHGHPLGATGVALVTKAVHEMRAADKELSLVTMCCGGGLGTGTLLRRLS